MPNYGGRRRTAGLALLLLGWLAVFIGFPGRLRAQGETTSAIVGTVADPSGGFIAGATVTIVETETGSKRTAKTDSSGRFGFPQLRPGQYSVKADVDGFESQINQAVSAGLGQRQTVDFVLKLATEKGEVVVTGEAPLVNPAEPQHRHDAERQGAGESAQPRQ